MHMGGVTFGNPWHQYKIAFTFSDLELMFVMMILNLFDSSSVAFITDPGL